MKKVLFVAYQFPPKGGPGVHRSLNLVKYLPTLGYKPYVLTVREGDLVLAKAKIDKSLLKEVPKEAEIISVSSCEPLKLINFLQKIKLYRIFWFLFYPFLWEYGAMWSFFTYKKAKEIVQANDIQLVYTSGAPFSSLILGYLLQKRLKIKWVADLRDPFTDAYVWQYPSKLHWYLARWFEGWLFSKPDKLIVNTPEVEKLYLKRGIIAKEKITQINNGF